jgi:hypothetical protein
MVVISPMATTSMLLMLLVGVSVVLVILVVLERFSQVHLHRIVLVTSPPIHHSIVTLVSVTLVVEHAECLRRLSSGRSRGRGSIGVRKRYAAASGSG